MRKVSYESPYDKSVTYRVTLSYIREHYPELGVSLNMKVAWAIAEAIQKSQVLPLLTNLAAANQALDLVGVPPAVRTAEHPDIIDQMSARLPDLLKMAFPAGEDGVLHELLDMAALSRSDALGSTLTLPERLKSGIDELLIRRELASKWAESAAKQAATPTELIAVSPTRPLPVHQIIGQLIEQMMPLIAIDPRLTARIEEISSRFAAMAADQGTMRHQVNQLHRLVTDRLGKDRQLRQDIDRGFTRIEHKITQIERAAKVTAQMNDRQHAGNREQIVALERQIVALKQQIVALKKAVSEPREDTAEILLREALGGSEVAEILRQINQRAAQPLVPVAVVQSAFPAKTSALSSNLRAALARQDQILIAAIEPADYAPSHAELLRALAATRRGDGGPINQPPSSPVTVPQPPVPPRQAPVPAPQPPTRQIRGKKNKPVGLIWCLIVIMAVMLALVSFGTYPLATTTSYPATNPIAQLQERWAETGENGTTALRIIAQSYRDDGEAYLKNSAIRAFGELWAAAISTNISQPLLAAVDNLSQGKTDLLAAGKVNPAYGFPKDTASVVHWHKFLGLLATEKSRNPKFNDVLAHQTAKSLENWLRGYQPPSVRDGAQKPLYAVPTPDQQYASVYSPFMQKLPWVKTACIVPRDVFQLKSSVPISVLQLHACPVVHLTPAMWTTLGNPLPGERALALKHPDIFWTQFCIPSQKIQFMHDYTNISIEEMKARQCR